MRRRLLNNSSPSGPAKSLQPYVDTALASYWLNDQSLVDQSEIVAYSGPPSYEYNSYISVASLFNSDYTSSNNWPQILMNGDASYPSPINSSLTLKYTFTRPVYLTSIVLYSRGCVYDIDYHSYSFQDINTGCWLGPGIVESDPMNNPDDEWYAHRSYKSAISVETADGTVTYYARNIGDEFSYNHLCTPDTVLDTELARWFPYARPLVNSQEYRANAYNSRYLWSTNNLDTETDILIQPGQTLRIMVGTRAVGDCSYKKHSLAALKGVRLYGKTV